MLESYKDSKREAFREDGLSLDDMASMITAADTQEPPVSVHTTDPDDVIYEPGQLPDGLIDLPSASKRYGIPVKTLGAWVRRGKLPKCGRLRGPSPGRGYLVTVEAEIEYCRDNPRKPGPKGSVVS